jgi:hypothetical protein
MESVKTHSPKAIAQKHGVYIDVIMRQLEMGIKIEQEHTTNSNVAREIALDHLTELPDYYTRLKKMEESDIQDILHRSGIQSEAKKNTRTLDSFENLITDIALRLIDEDGEMDAATAGMDILDAINDRVMTESVRRKAGTWYDPIARALEILEDELPEDMFAAVKDRMQTGADEYIMDREDGMEDEYECDIEDTSIGDMATDLMSAGFALDRDGLKRLSAVVQQLQQMEESIGRPIEMRFTKWSGDELEMRNRAGLTEQCACELMDDHGANNFSMNDTLRQVIPELKGIAMHYVQDKASQQRLNEIADQLKALKQQVGL